MSSDAELRGSIVATGCLDPLLIWHGLIIDGRRRHRICEELGLVPPMLVCTTLQSACSALFVRHPERAVILAREHLGGHAGLPPTVRELAEVCGTSVAAIAVVVRPPRASSKRAPHRTRSQRTEGVKLWVEPQWLYYVKQAAEREGMNLSAFIRAATWARVQVVLPNKPTEGTYRAPSVGWVKPKPERRLVKSKRH